ncbi:STAS domain-containing protein [Streptomyces sp. NPDC001903]|uniref:STAS domain-containing protein n=1 Tax=Streptomyces sp. NPDC001903 TaxID=3364622 RepID=UPI00369DC072
MSAAREGTTAARADDPRSTVRVRPDGAGGALVVVAGEIDQDCAPELGEALASALRAHPGAMVVDLAGVTFCDCTCLNVLLQARRKAGARFSVRNISARMSRLLELTGTCAYFPNGAGPRAHPPRKGRGRV